MADDSSPVSLTVRPARRRDARAAERVLAAAFFDDPIFSWVFPDESRRLRQVRRYFRTGLRHHCLHQGGVEIAMDGKRTVGVAIWLPPGRRLASVPRQLIMIPGFLWAAGRRVAAGSELLQAVERVHPHVPHWYLEAIAVAPDHQGRGVGSALLRSRLKRCDDDGVPAYLESSKLTNVPIYEHVGFIVTGRIPLPAGAPPSTAMWRTGTSGVLPDRVPEPAATTPSQ